ncbi:unnamed protein product [Cunninghamella blakesleeana]
MPSNKKSRTGRLFYCTGYGDCKMVFTRGEHLARHIRKHTGEKPFECIIPDCTKTFSRFDNMMQHTQTHKRREQYHHTSSSSSSSSSSLSSSSHPQEQTYYSSNKKKHSHFQQQTMHPLYTNTHKKGNDHKDLIAEVEEDDSHKRVLLRQPNIGLTSPVSLASSLDSSDEEELDEPKDHHYHHQKQPWVYHPLPPTHRRRLSVADLCHPIDQPPNIHHQLSFDEVEALLAFGKLQQSNSL